MQSIFNALIRNCGGKKQLQHKTMPKSSHFCINSGQEQKFSKSSLFFMIQYWVVMHQIRQFIAATSKNPTIQNKIQCFREIMLVYKFISDIYYIYIDPMLFLECPHFTALGTASSHHCNRISFLRCPFLHPRRRWRSRFDPRPSTSAWSNPWTWIEPCLHIVLFCQFRYPTSAFPCFTLPANCFQSTLDL